MGLLRRQTIAALVRAALPLALLFFAALLLTGSDAGTLAAAASNPFAQPPQEHAPAPGTAPDRARVAEALHSSPVMFIENVGQFSEGARFQLRGGDHTLWLAEDALWVTVVETPPQPSPTSGKAFRRLPPVDGGIEGGELRRGVNLKLTFPGANPHPRIEPFNRLDTHVSYFIGNDPTKWHPDVPVWGGVRYVGLYPGIDLEITGESGQMVQRLVTQPGADLNVVRLRVEGADALALEGGRLRLTTAVGAVTLPLLQAMAADGSPIPRAAEGPGVRANEITAPFSSAPSLPSPSAQTAGASDLLYATFLGGSDYEHGDAITVDRAGSAYVTGWTKSFDFPTTVGVFDTSHNSNEDAFVVKLNTTGTGLVYATYLGGNNRDEAYDIVVDEAGAAYITGPTFSSNYPTTPGAFDTIFNGGTWDAFVTKLNADASALVYSTFVGGSGSDSGHRIALDGSGAVYITGQTTSSNFPTTAEAFDKTANGNWDAFVTKLNAAGSNLVYSTFLGGSGMDAAIRIVVNGIGAACVTGYTESSNFPTTTQAFDRSFNGGQRDAFVTKLNATGSALVYSTFLGGGSSDEGWGIAVDRYGAAYVTGPTTSSDFPVTPEGFQTTYGGGGDAFITKLNAAGGGLVYSTYLGNSNYEISYWIEIDPMTGVAYITGLTSSSNFPITPGAFQTVPGGSSDAFMTSLSATGSGLVYSSYLGGSGDELGRSIDADSSGAIYVTGRTTSTDFPTTPGAFDTTHNGGRDAFVAKLAVGGVGPTPSPTESPPSYVDPQPDRSDDTFYGTDNQPGYKGQINDPIQIPITVTRFYGDAPNGILDAPHRAALAPHAELTVHAFDVDCAAPNCWSVGATGERDGVYLNGHLVGYLRGQNATWQSTTFDQVDLDWVRFPTLTPGSAVAPPDTTFATNLITLTVDELDLGYKTQIAWARLRVPGARPVLLVHGFPAVDLIEGVEIQNGWTGWRCWTSAQPNTSDSHCPNQAGLLWQHGFPNIRPQWENEDYAGGILFGGRESDARVYTSGTDSYLTNAPRIHDLVERVKTRYGMDKVNLVGHSKGSIDSRAYVAIYGDSSVENVGLAGGPNKGTPLADATFVASAAICVVESHLCDIVFKLLVPKEPAAHEITWTYMNTIFNPWFDRLRHQQGDHSAHLHTVAGKKWPDWPAKIGGILLKPLGDSDGAVPMWSANAEGLDWPARHPVQDTDHGGLVQNSSVSGNFVFDNIWRDILLPPEVTRPGRVTYATTARPGPEAQIQAVPAQAPPAIQFAAVLSGTIAAGQVQTHTLPLDGRVAVVALAWETGPLTLTLATPAGQPIGPGSPGITYTASLTDTPRFIGYEIPTPQPGTWRAQVEASTTLTAPVDYLLLATLDSTTVLTTEVLPLWVPHDTPVTVRAGLRAGVAPITSATVTATVALLDTILAVLPLHDDGTHDDGTPGDGIYGGTFTDTGTAGSYTAAVEATGSAAGVPFVRHAVGVFTVGSQSAMVGGPYAEATHDTDGDGLFNTLTVSPTVTATLTMRYALLGTLTDATGQVIVAASQVFTASVGTQPVGLAFDGVAIAASGRDGPYQVRDLSLVELGEGSTGQADAIDPAYVTAAYTASQFQRDAIQVDTLASDTVLDADGNGKHDWLQVVLTVTVRTSGAYTLTASLTDADGQPVTSVFTATTLAEGTYPLVLAFDGQAINRSGHDGPYQVRDLSITGPGGVIWLVTHFFDTQSYEATEFQLFGDFDGDCRVRVADVMRMAAHWGVAVDGVGYDLRFDADRSSLIDLSDIQTIAGQWQEICQ